MPRRKVHSRGIECPTCRGFRLCVVKKLRVCRGLVCRRVECSVCGSRFNTEERLSKSPNVVPRPPAGSGVDR